MMTCVCRATGVCTTCQRFARIAAEAFARSAQRAAERRARDRRDRLDHVERRVDCIDAALARYGVR